MEHRAPELLRVHFRVHRSAGGDVCSDTCRILWKYLDLFSAFSLKCASGGTVRFKGYQRAKTFSLTDGGFSRFRGVTGFHHMVPLEVKLTFRV